MKTPYNSILWSAFLLAFHIPVIADSNESAWPIVESMAVRGEILFHEGERDKRLKVFDVGSRLIHEFAVHDAEVIAAAYSPDEKTIALVAEEPSSTTQHLPLAGTLKLFSREYRSLRILTSLGQNLFAAQWFGLDWLSDKRIEISVICGPHFYRKDSLIWNNQVMKRPFTATYDLKGQLREIGAFDSDELTQRKASDDGRYILSAEHTRQIDRGVAVSPYWAGSMIFVVCLEDRRMHKKCIIFQHKSKAVQDVSSFKGEMTSCRICRRKGYFVFSCNQEIYEVVPREQMIIRLATLPSGSSFLSYSSEISVTGL